MNNYFITNKETNKIELHFEKNTYLSLDDNTKADIKSACLFSRYAGAWVSRGFIGSYSAHKAVEIALKLGLDDQGKTGEKLSFAEIQERKAERAEIRAERYENHAVNAMERGHALQKPIEDMHGDIAFFTQPNINTSAGRSFTNKRNKMFSAWERGFDEFKKSDYWKERAQAARNTAKGCKLQSIDFCQRRIDECTSAIKKLNKNIEGYKKQLERLNNGETIKRYNGDDLTIEVIEGWIDESIDRIDSYIDKSSYYEDMIAQQGGIKFNKDNINIGDIVKCGRRDMVTVERKGPKNFIGKSLSGFALQYNYSEIIEVVKAQTGAREIKHGFKVGMKYTLTERLSYATDEKKDHVCEIVKVTPDKVTIKIDNGRAKALSVRNGYNNDYYIPVTYGKRDTCTWLKPLEA